MNAQTNNKIVDGDIFPNIRYDKNFVINSEGERNHTTGVSSTMVTSRTAVVDDLISGQFTYTHTASAASQTVKFNSVPLPAGLNGQTCEGSFYYRFGSLSIPFIANVLSGTTVIASGTLVNSGVVSDTVKHTMTYPCSVGLAPIIEITSTASSALSLKTDKFFTGAYLKPDPSTINLVGGVSGVLPIANGGTNNGSLGTTSGTVVYMDGSKAVNTAQGTSGTILASQGASAPVWISKYSVSAVAASAIDWALANSHTKTLSANTTFTFSNAIAGQNIVVRLTNTASNYTVTWPTVRWSGGVAPVMTVGAKSDVYTFFYDGSNYYGSAVQDMN